MRSDAPSIRPFRDTDAAAVWAVLRPVFRAGETYPLPRGIGEADALAHWTHGKRGVLIAADPEGGVLGTAYWQANQPKGGGGGRVANAGFAVAEAARGRGVAAALCREVEREAREAGFSAMQFNFVIASNASAVRLWTRLGYAAVGRLPGAFEHPTLGRVDALVMFKELG